MAAYGLYSHIRTNRVRSVILIVGLFFLLLLLTFAGSLIASVFLRRRRAARLSALGARQNTIAAIPFVAIGTLIWLWIAWLFTSA
jgi:heat shock protein HtpX